MKRIAFERVDDWLVHKSDDGLLLIDEKGLKEDIDVLLQMFTKYKYAYTKREYEAYRDLWNFVHDGEYDE